VTVATWIVAGTLLITGTALIAVAGIGLLRLPDVYNRMNAVAKAASLGLICILLGAWVLSPDVRGAGVVGAAILLQLLTAPVGGFALARAAHRAGVRPAAGTRYDRLAERDSPAGAPRAGGTTSDTDGRRQR
jgi:multicomponent Na+:H+ antiporter subunit G